MNANEFAVFSLGVYVIAFAAIDHLFLIHLLRKNKNAQVIPAQENDQVYVNPEGLLLFDNGELNAVIDGIHEEEKLHQPEKGIYWIGWSLSCITIKK